ncbi:MAG: hypothetical protein Q7V62_07360, partial [Actinomycetota bacterium]|nr:hypothetical protein [Actinomycetota bacterium]
DADQVVAEALRVEHLELQPFAPMDDAAEESVRDLAALADAIVVTEVPFGHGNVGNLRAAVGSGRPLVLVGSIEGRDFARGAAEQAWAEALATGATVAERIDAVEPALEALLPRRESDASDSPA